MLSGLQGKDKIIEDLTEFCSDIELCRFCPLKDKRYKCDFTKAADEELKEAYKEIYGKEAGE